MSLHKQAKALGITASNKKENEDIFRELMAISKEPMSLDEKRDEGRQVTNRLVEGNMGYVVSKVESFLDEHTDYSHLKDDLISEGFLTLSRVADNLLAGEEVSEEEFNPQAMLSVSLRNAFLNSLRLERSTRDERSIPLSDAIAGMLVENGGEDSVGALDLKLDILDCCESDTEREVVQLRCEGLIDQEISERIGLDEGHIARLRRSLYERFSRKQ